MKFCVFLFRIANLVFSSFSFLLEWAWDATSDLIKQGMFALSGMNNSIATKIADNYYENCMMTGPVMEGTGKHTIPMKLGQGDEEKMDICMAKGMNIPSIFSLPPTHQLPMLSQ